MGPREICVGVIADTHNLIRPEAVQALTGCDLILHAGDICKPEVLEQLGAIAEVAAVRGNNDKGAWASQLPVTRSVVYEGVKFFLIHDVQELEGDPAESGHHMVVFGHSHRPLQEKRGGVLYLNPGSAGPRRFKLPVSLALVRISEAGPTVEMIDLI